MLPLEPLVVVVKDLEGGFFGVLIGVLETFNPCVAFADCVRKVETKDVRDETPAFVEMLERSIGFGSSLGATDTATAAACFSFAVCACELLDGSGGSAVMRDTIFSNVK
jgi:hypothetical protein